MAGETKGQLTTPNFLKKQQLKISIAGPGCLLGFEELEEEETERTRKSRATCISSKGEIYYLSYQAFNNFCKQLTIRRNFLKEKQKILPFIDDRMNSVEK